MTGAQRAQLRKQLRALADELAGRTPRKLEANREVAGEVGGAEDEQPLNEMLQAIASNRNRNDEVLTQRVEAALAKLKDSPDSYGECEECGEEIPLGRLKAMPYAELCVSCQAKRDGPRGGPTRRKVTDFS